MELSKSLKKILLVSASVLMIASVGGASAQSLAPNINAQAKTTRVHHHKHHRHNYKHNKRHEDYILDSNKYKTHKHHKHHKAHRHHEHRRAHKHYRKYSHKHGKHFSKKHQQAYDDLGKSLRHKILKYHKRYVKGGTYKVVGNSYYAEGFKNASQEGEATNNLPNHMPGIIVKNIKHDHGSKNNYELGWIDGYVNGNFNDRLRPSRDTKFRLYNDALKLYVKMCDYVAQPVNLRDKIVYTSDV